MVFIWSLSEEEIFLQYHAVYFNMICNPKKNKISWRSQYRDKFMLFMVNVYINRPRLASHDSICHNKGDIGGLIVKKITLYLHIQIQARMMFKMVLIKYDTKFIETDYIVMICNFTKQTP